MGRVCLPSSGDGKGIRAAGIDPGGFVVRIPDEGLIEFGVWFVWHVSRKEVNRGAAAHKNYSPGVSGFGHQIKKAKGAASHR